MFSENSPSRRTSCARMLVCGPDSAKIMCGTVWYCLALFEIIQPLNSIPHHLQVPKLVQQIDKALVQAGD